MKIRNRAVDPRQYDGQEAKWEEEGASKSPIRRLFLENLSPFLGQVAGKRVLDVGCGQGWLCDALYQNGATPVGIDPSQKNILAARRNYPHINFEQSDLLSYRNGQPFDAVTAIMVFEHIDDLKRGYSRVAQLMKPDDSKFLMIAADFDKATKSRKGCTVETEELGPGEVATRTDYGDRSGVLYDINRTTERLIEDAGSIGLSLLKATAICPPDWLVEECPRYSEAKDKPRFHMLEFGPAPLG